MDIKTCGLITLAGISLSGCAITGQSPLTTPMDSVREQAAQAHSAAALAHEQSGDTWAALEEWRIVSALKPDSKDVTKRIHELEVSAASSSVRLLEQARREKARGSLRSAQKLALSALALDPESTNAQELLRSIEASRTRYRLAAEPLESAPPKPESEYYGKLVTEETQDETAPTVGADSELAEAAYRRGLALFAEDKAGAARAFEDALKYDPDHQKARTYRDTLRRLGLE